MAPDWLPLPEDWEYPHLLLAGLVFTVLVTGVVAASTSSTAFGAYNPAWDGAADLRQQADAVDTEVETALNTTSYLSSPANQTIAVVIAPDEEYSRLEVGRIRSFLARGGTLVIAEDFGQPGNSLLADLGSDTRVDGTPVRDEREYYRSPALPVATNVSEANETTGVDQLTLNHGSVITNRSASNQTNSNMTVLVRTSEFAYLDKNGNEELDDTEEMRRHPVVVREEVANGTVYVVSDPSMFINAMLDQPGNRRFVRNLFDAHDRMLLDLSHQSSQPPLAVALLMIRDMPLLQVFLGVFGVIAVIGWFDIRTTIGSWINRRQGDIVDSTGQVDRDVLAAYVERRHPDWDEAKVRRVMTGVLDHRTMEEDND